MEKKDQPITEQEASTSADSNINCKICEDQRNMITRATQTESTDPIKNKKEYRIPASLAHMLATGTGVPTSAQETSTGCGFPTTGTGVSPPVKKVSLNEKTHWTPMDIWNATKKVLDTNIGSNCIGLRGLTVDKGTMMQFLQKRHNTTFEILDVAAGIAIIRGKPAIDFEDLSNAEIVQRTGIEYLLNTNI